MPKQEPNLFSRIFLTEGETIELYNKPSTIEVIAKKQNQSLESDSKEESSMKQNQVSFKKHRHVQTLSSCCFKMSKTKFTNI